MEKNNMGAIQLTTSPTEESLVGKSHWWGAPDLPPGVPYPCVKTLEDGNEYDDPLTFLCQIQMADVTRFDTEGLLPRSGMLYFFAAIDYFLGEPSPLQLSLHGAAGDTVKVVYAPDTTGLKPYEMHWEGTAESVFRPAEAIRFAQAPLLGDGHRMLGRPYQDEVADAYPSFVSLLQVDEDDRWGLRFFDCGTMYLLITPEALRQRRFEEVQCEVFTY